MPIYRTLAAVSLLTMSLAIGAAPARAATPGPQTQVVNDYAVALVLPAGPAQTHSNDIVITLHDPSGEPVVGATVTAAILAYAADTHQGNADGGQHNQHEAAPSESSQHRHDGGATGSEGHGLDAIPVMMEPGSEPGTYRGPLFFTEVGVATVTVAFTINGQDRAAIFTIPVAQAHSRGLVLGAFAVINGLAIAAAAVLKQRMPRRGRGQHNTGRPAPQPSISASAPTQEGDPA